VIAWLLLWLRRALIAGVAFTGVAFVGFVRSGDVDGAALYGLLCALCVLGLLVKTADKRST
jgi:hypothetical protein